MNIVEMTFSPTGGTQKVASSFLNAFQGERTKIDLMKEVESREFSHQDFCVISVPSYGGRVPSIALERIKRLKGNETQVVLIAVFGNRAIDDTLIELQDTVENQGFHCIAAVEAVAQHSLIKDFGRTRPDEADCKELENFGNQVQKIINTDKKGKLVLPGKRPYVKYKGVPIQPKATSACTSCGLCIQECPTGAISNQNPKIIEKSKCISCMHCVVVCPQNAKKINSALVEIARLSIKKSCEGRKENKLIL